MEWRPLCITVRAAVLYMLPRQGGQGDDDEESDEGALVSAERERAQLESINRIQIALDTLLDELPNVRDPMFGLNRAVVIELDKALAPVGLKTAPLIDLSSRPQVNLKTEP